MTCNCKSYNLDDPDCGKDAELELVPPRGIGLRNRTICVDACIAEAVLAVWNGGFATLGSCCGHNKEKPSLILTDDTDKQQAQKIRELIKPVDSREFKLIAWKLTDL